MADLNPSGGNSIRVRIPSRDAAINDAVAFWDTGSPGYRWNQISAQLTTADPAPETFRVPTYMNLAIYDATIAAWASKQRYSRQRPSRVRKGLATAAATPNSPSYPSEHGATAGAAVAVLSHLYPAKAAELAAQAAKHGASRIAAGLEFPSDFEAGYALGKAVGAKVAAFLDGDSFGASWLLPQPRQGECRLSRLGRHSLHKRLHVRCGDGPSGWPYGHRVAQTDGS